MGLFALGAVAAIGGAIYGASNTGVSAPPARDPYQEARANLQAQIDVAPQEYNAYRQYAPAYASSNVQSLNTALFGQVDTDAFLKAHPEFQDGYKQALGDGDTGSAYQWLQRATANAGVNLSSAPKDSANSIVGLNNQLTANANQQSQISNTAQRTADINDVSNLAGQVNDLRKANNSQLYGSMDQFSQNAFGPIQQSISQQQQQQLASQGFGQFDPSNLYANTNYSANRVMAPSSVSGVQANNVQAAQGNPLLGTLMNRAQGNGIDPLLAQQNQVASGLLASGGQLTPSELRNVQQSSRAGFAARGLDATNASIVDEALQTDQAQRARLQQNLGIAQGVEGQNQAATQTQNSLGLGAGSQALNYGQLGLQAQQANQGAGLQAQQANQAAGLQLGQQGLTAQQANQAAGLQAQNLSLQAQQANQGFGLNSFQANTQSQEAQAQALQQAALLAQQQQQLQSQLQQQSIANYQSTYFDPFQGVLGRSSGNVGTNNALYGMGNGQSQPANAQAAGMFQPQNAYASDLYNTNYNGQAAANIAISNNQMALAGGLMSMGGSFMQGAGSAYCWVAREVYGAHNPKWLLFRAWMLTKAPKWFSQLYLKHGEQFADWIQDKPLAKNILRYWMDTRIASLNSPNHV